MLNPTDVVAFREKLKNPNMPYLSKKAMKKKLLGMSFNLYYMINQNTPMWVNIIGGKVSTQYIYYSPINIYYHSKIVVANE